MVDLQTEISELASCSTEDEGDPILLSLNIALTTNKNEIKYPCQVEGNHRPVYGERLTKCRAVLSVGGCELYYVAGDRD